MQAIHWQGLDLKKKIPYTLEEAAMIDGCSRLQALIKIIPPVMKPGIIAFIGKYDIDWGMMTAGSVIALIPIFIMFGVIQKYLVGGLTDAAVKG